MVTMKTIILRRAGQVLIALAAVSALGGCAVYSAPPPGYADGGVVYAAPAPVYVAPPVYFNFGFGTWGGGWHHRGWHHGGWGRGRW